jgi:hypothetical protein
LNFKIIFSKLHFKDFKIIAEASIIYLNDSDKLERLNTLNQSLVQVENCKDVAKWLLKSVSIVLKQNIDEDKLSKHFQLHFGLNEQKANTLKEIVSK